MLINNQTEIDSNNIFYKIKDFFGFKNLNIKLEGLNIAGSIKIKAAIYLIDNLEKNYNISPSKNTIIESSSGNLGIALSIVCKSKGYKFICVIDPNIPPLSRKLMEVYGAEIMQVTKKDKSGGYLSTRIELIEKLLEDNKNIVWTNQYSSKVNTFAHYNTTAKEILREIKTVDYLFIGAGTTGTLTGCAQYFKEYSSNTKIIAVDAKGSVTFGYPPSARYIPGLGTSKKPGICSTDNIFDILLVEETDTIRMCHYLLKKYCLFLGGSSGTILEAVRRYANKINQNLTVVAISPDFGDKYLDTVYNYEWIKNKYGIDFMQEVEDESKLFNYYS